MGLWADQLLPRLTDRLLDVEAVRKARAEVCADLTGDVVELGFGSGLNVPHYPPTLGGVWAIDPSEVGLRLAGGRIRESPVRVVHAGFTAEALAFPDGRFDCALSTFTLCTVPDVSQALRELYRVLRPGGTFHFLEHGRAPDTKVARWQDRLAPFNQAVAGGCHLTRDIGSLIRAAGLRVDDYATYYGEGPRPFAYRYQGMARRPAAP